MGGGHKMPFAKDPWSTTGGPYGNNRNGTRNTLIIVAVSSLLIYGLCKLSYNFEKRYITNDVIHVAPTQHWGKNYLRDDPNYEVKLRMQQEKKI